MAHIALNCFSNALNMEIRLEAVLSEYSAGGRLEKLPLLLLLHGMTGSESSYCRFSALERYATAYRMAIVMPATHMGAYTNQYAGLRYFDFVACELPEICASYLPVSTRREDTWAAGLSMGGYGALKLGLTYPERFSRIAVMSAGCDRLALLPPQYETFDSFDALYAHGDQLTQAQRQAMTQFLSTFGSPARFRQDERNNLFLLACNAARKEGLPAIRMWCGAEDALAAGPNRRFHAHLDSLGVAHTYIEDHGVHDWAYWDGHLPDLLAWLNASEN